MKSEDTRDGDGGIGTDPYVLGCAHVPSVCTITVFLVSAYSHWSARPIANGFWAVAHPPEDRGRSAENPRRGVEYETNEPISLCQDHYCTAENIRLDSKPASRNDLSTSTRLCPQEDPPPSRTPSPTPQIVWRGRPLLIFLAGRSGALSNQLSYSSSFTPRLRSDFLDCQPLRAPRATHLSYSAIKSEPVASHASPTLPPSPRL